jgi:hypothetical protein
MAEQNVSMLYMVIERYRSGPRPVYGRVVGDRNRLVPVDIEILHEAGQPCTLSLPVTRVGGSGSGAGDRALASARCQ